jgi:TPR repeat protein
VFQLCGSLKQVVDNAAQRWFWECLRQAKLGDAQNQMLVSQMYLEGYGIAVSESKSTYWKLTARANGARRLEGVYDRLE